MNGEWYLSVEQTPDQYVRRLGRRYPEQMQNLMSPGFAYGRIAYARGKVATQELAPLQELRQWLASAAITANKFSSEAAGDLTRRSTKNMCRSASCHGITFPFCHFFRRVCLGLCLELLDFHLQVWRSAFSCESLLWSSI